MTINDYLQNPYGKGSSFSNISKQKEDLEAQYSQYSNKFACKIYQHQKNVIFHVIVPSVKKDFVTYDVVLEMNLGDKTAEAIDVNNLEFKCFSNCPSFIFTYANAFRQKGLLCHWLENKYRKEVKKNTANIKNQYGIIGLERSLYLACLYLKKTGRTRADIITTNSKKVSNYSTISNGIRTQDEIMEKTKLKINPEDKNSISGINDINFKSQKKESTRKGTQEYTKVTNSTLFTKSVQGQNKTTTTKTSKKTRRI